MPEIMIDIEHAGGEMPPPQEDQRLQRMVVNLVTAGLIYISEDQMVHSPEIADKLLYIVMILVVCTAHWVAQEKLFHKTDLTIQNRAATYGAIAALVAALNIGLHSRGL
jgi:hypothetical protein